MHPPLKITNEPIKKKELREAKLWRFVEVVGDIFLAILGIVAGLLALIAGFFKDD